MSHVRRARRKRRWAGGATMRNNEKVARCEPPPAGCAGVEGALAKMVPFAPLALRCPFPLRVGVAGVPRCEKASYAIYRDISRHSTVLSVRQYQIRAGGTGGGAQRDATWNVHERGAHPHAAQTRIRPLLLALCAQRTAARTERGASPQRREPPAPPCPPPTATHEQQRHESQSFKMPRAQGQGARAWVR